ncbi:MAG: LacI family DNA-binding transcriptional regulator [Rhizobiales bacterium]|nr:LacI family DNA-binding transcriptional regulator [Hyphomicrobiales bacterium]
MKVSIRDVAARAGVSTGTVSNVLNGKPTVQPHLVDRVRKAARELGFEPDQAAAQLRGRPARIVAALVPDLYNPYFTSLLAALEQRVRESGYGLIVASANESPREERERLTALLAWRPAGLVIVPCTDEFRGRSLVTQRRVPFVVMDRIPVSFRGDAVTIDNVDAGRLAADHLVSLGHRHVVVAASTLRLRNIRERCEGVRQAFEARGLDAPRIFEVGTDFDPAADALSAFMAEGQRPTALLALTAIATLGILTSLQRRGLRIPQDMSVVGFDDYSWMQAVSPPLTSIRQPVEAMGREAWERLRARIDGSVAAPTRISLLCERIERASTSAPLPAQAERDGARSFRRPKPADEHIRSINGGKPANDSAEQVD